ncbi:MAG: hypothetical protein ACYTFI_05795 [Planctomycetota bacterium]|jgi:hypothetical protein
MKSAVFDPRIVALLAAGCAVGTARWDVDPARPIGLAEQGTFAEALPAAGLHADASPGLSGAGTAGPVEPLPLAAARAAGERESQGLGVFGRMQMATFGGTRTLAFKPPAGGPLVRYPDIFDPGFGFGASVILSRPPFDDLSITSFWLEAKTMLKPMGATGRLKPYVLLGAGLAITSEVTGSVNGNQEILLDTTLVPALRGRLGIEYRAGNIGLFGEFGAHMVGAPSTGPNVPYGNGDPIFYVPFGGGIIINF